MGEPESKPSPSPPSGKLPGWARVLAAVSVLVMAVGVALPLLAGRNSAVPPPTDSPGEKSAVPAGAAGLTGETSPGPSGGAAAPVPARYASWGPAVFRLGFSAFVGFAVGFALRSFVKLALVALGFFFLALFGLQYAGIIEVRWALLAEKYRNVSDEIQSNAAGVWTSVTAVLPAGASATAGLIAGFWRRGG